MARLEIEEKALLKVMVLADVLQPNPVTEMELMVADTQVGDDKE